MLWALELGKGMRGPDRGRHFTPARLCKKGRKNSLGAVVGHRGNQGTSSNLQLGGGDIAVKSQLQGSRSQRAAMGRSRSRNA